jgi:hypothetical protein
LAAVAALVVVCVGLQLAVGSVIRWRISVALERAAGLELHASSAWYLPPWGVSMHGVRITRPLPDGTRTLLFSGSRLLIRLIMRQSQIGRRLNRSRSGH